MRRCLMPLTFTKFRRPAAIAGGLLISATALAACSGSFYHHTAALPPATTTSQAPKATSTTTSSGPSSTPTSSGTGSTESLPQGSVPINTTTTAPLSAANAGPTCTKAQLSIAQSGGNITATGYVAQFTLTNTSSSRCSLNGYPVPIIIGALGPLATHPTNNGVSGQKAYAVSTVSLSPKGGAASFLMSWNPISSPAASSCPDGTEIEFTLPNVKGGLTAQSTVKACGGNVNLSPLQPNVVEPTT